jgi:3'-phosphoadenosine 5'-phosphosulfate sulfotransferase (PAPS reductase)/FAD synthetase
MNKQTIIDENIPVIASFSGGKDSTALVLYLLYESGIPKDQIHIVFADTGWEHQHTYEQVQLMSEIHPVEIVRSKKYPDGMPQLMKERGIPIQLARFCTQELKVYPLREYQSKFNIYVSARGIRKEEATATNNRDVDEFEYDYGTLMYTWYPIAEYTLQDVWDIHHRYNFRVNPLYDMGFSRVGCAPCIFSVKKDIAKYGEISKDNIDIIRQAEKQRNFPYISPVGKPKQYLNKVSNKGKPYADIDSIMKWANTDSKDHKHYKPEEKEDNPDEDIQGTCSEGLCE